MNNKEKPKNIILVSGAEMARLLSVSTTAVIHWRNDGIIHFEPNSKKYDKDKTLAILEKHRGRPLSEGEETASPEFAAQSNDDILKEFQGLSKVGADIKKQVYAALKVKLEVEKLMGKLVEAKEVDKRVHDIGRMVRNNMLNIGPRLMDQLAAETDPYEVEKMLTGAINDALEGLVDEIERCERSIRDGVETGSDFNGESVGGRESDVVNEGVGGAG